MDYEKFTIKAQEALNEACSIAQRGDHSQVEVEHVLLALLRQEDGIVPPIVDKIGADSSRLAKSVEALVEKQPKIYGEAAQVYFSSAASKALAKAENEAASLKDEFVSAEHILISIAAAEGKAA
jgi:ATP-dependent Clp protease ATP-binding subunit ClpB